MSVEGSVKKQIGRFDLLDIARFLCAAWVLLYHNVYTYTHVKHGADVSAIPLLVSQYGYMGVEFFFIISGFVIAFSSRGKTALQFFESRFFRIWPTFVICMTATALVLYFTGDRAFNLVEYVANLTIVPSYLGIQPYDGVYWTLAYEIFFYAIVFALILLRICEIEKWLLLVGPVVLLLLAVFHLSEASYLALFLIGVGFYSVGQGKYRTLALGSMAVMMVLAIAGAYVRADALGFSGPAGAVILAVLFLVFGLLTLGPLANKTVRRARDIGLVTYPLYLLHSKIGTALMELAGPEFGWAAKVAATAVLLVLCSWLVSRLDMGLIQGPVRRFYRAGIRRFVPVSLTQ